MQQVINSYWNKGKTIIRICINIFTLYITIYPFIHKIKKIINISF